MPHSTRLYQGAAHSQKCVLGNQAMHATDTTDVALQMIIPVATRTQEGAQKLLDTIKCRAFMAEEISLPLKK